MSEIFTTSWQAWSCDFQLELINPTVPPSTVVTEIKKCLQEYEQTCSRFIRNSPVWRLNQGEKILPSNLLKTVIDEAQQLSEKIGAEYFSPQVNLAAQGYKTTFKKSQPEPLFESIETALPPSPSLYNEDPNGLISLNAGGKIDFGGFLKGALSEKIADKYESLVDGLVVNFGGDLSVRGQDEHQQQFNIGIYNPVTQSDHYVPLYNQSLCTSGRYKRTWKTQHGPAHHLTNPLTQKSAQSPWVSISVWGRSGGISDAIATAAFNTPITQWKAWQEVFTDLHFMAIAEDGSTFVLPPKSSL